MNDIETIQKARGWRECSEHEGFWLRPGGAKRCERPLPDPLADTPEGWFEFGQIITWATGKKWSLSIETAHDDLYQADVYLNAETEFAMCIGEFYGGFREAAIGAIAQAVHYESEDEK